MDRYFAVLKEKRAHVFPRGTTVLAAEPAEEFGGPHRSERLYVYALDLDPSQLTGGPETYRLAVEIRFPQALRGEVLLSLGHLDEVERKLEEKEREREMERERVRERRREERDDDG